MTYKVTIDMRVFASQSTPDTAGDTAAGSTARAAHAWKDGDVVWAQVLIIPLCPYMSALYVRLICLPYMSLGPLHASYEAFCSRYQIIPRVCMCVYVCLSVGELASG